MTAPSSDWVFQYIQFMLTDNPEEGIPLKSNYFPDRFFRYCSLNDYTFVNLENDQLWLSPINKLNDPFECAMSLDYLASLRMFFKSTLFRKELERKSGLRLNDGEIGKIISDDDPFTAYREVCGSKGVFIDQTAAELRDLIMARWQAMLQDARKMIRVCCFTGRRDSVLMWSHYADNHVGICLEYDFRDVDEFRYLLQPIYYRDDFFQVSTMEDLTFTSHLMSAIQKSTDWSYEQEWRVTGIPQRNGKVPETVKAPLPQAIYLGVRFEQNKPEVQVRLRQIAGAKGIRLVQMAQDPAAYRIVPKPSA
jgi:Protein of unknown function (DUF2971)